MQWETSYKVFLGETVSAFEYAGLSDAIDRTASNYTDAKDKVKKIRELIKTGLYGTDIARYIPGVLEMKFQGMLDDVEELDFQILLKDNYYVNPYSIHLCFSMKIKKSTNSSSDIDGDLITVNNFFAHLIKEISVTKYGSDIELIPA